MNPATLPPGNGAMIPAAPATRDPDMNPATPATRDRGVCPAASATRDPDMSPGALRPGTRT